MSISAFLGLNYYVSELDQFLKNFDKTHTKLSLSQIKEKEKYKRIYHLRDNPNVDEKKEEIWGGF